MSENRNNALIYVRGIPNTSSRTLYNLFYSVAQINWLQYRKEEDSAVVCLFARQSLKFVLEQEFQIRDIRLWLYKKPRTTSSNSSITTKLKEYQKGRRGFWADVPHESAQIKRKQRRKKNLARRQDSRKENSSSSRHRRDVHPSSPTRSDSGEQPDSDLNNLARRQDSRKENSSSSRHRHDVHPSSLTRSDSVEQPDSDLMSQFIFPCIPWWWKAVPFTLFKWKSVVSR